MCGVAIAVLTVSHNISSMVRMRAPKSKLQTVEPNDKNDGN